MNHLFISNGVFLLTFPYDPTWVNIAKSIPGAQWDKHIKAWRYPISEITYEELKKKFKVSLLEFEQRNNGNGKINISTRKFKTPLYEHQKEGLEFLLQRMGVEYES